MTEKEAYEKGFNDTLESYCTEPYQFEKKANPLRGIGTLISAARKVKMMNSLPFHKYVQQAKRFGFGKGTEPYLDRVFAIANRKHLASLLQEAHKGMIDAAGTVKGREKLVLRDIIPNNSLRNVIETRYPGWEKDNLKHNLASRLDDIKAYFKRTGKKVDPSWFSHESHWYDTTRGWGSK